MNPTLLSGLAAKAIGECINKTAWDKWHKKEVATRKKMLTHAEAFKP